MIVVAAGTSLKASQTQSAANGTSSELIRADSVAETIRLPTVNRIRPRPNCVVPNSTNSSRSCRVGDIRSLEEAVGRREAPFYLRRVKEALVSFREPETGTVKALFTRRTSRPREFQISDEELDFFAPNLDRSTGLSAHWLSSVPEWHRARRRSNGHTNLPQVHMPSRHGFQSEWHGKG